MTSQHRYGTWWRRVADYALRMVIPTSLLSQLAGTLITGRSHPDGRTGTLIAAGSLLVVTAISGLTASPGRHGRTSSWTCTYVRPRTANPPGHGGWRPATSPT